MADNQGRVGGIDDFGGPEAWFRSQPIVTRTWFALSLILTCAGNFGVINIMSLVYNWTSISSKFEIWRLLTPFCYVGKFDLSTVFGLYMLVNFSKQYEAGPYNTGAGGGTADYIFALLFGIVCMLFTYSIFAYNYIMPLFTRNLTFYVLYIWSKRYPTLDANIWGFPIKALWLPFAYLALTVLMGNPFWDVVHGIAVGHLYYYLVDVVPLVYGKDVLQTPQFLIDYFGVGEYVPPVPVANNANNARNTGFAAPGNVNAPTDPARRNTGGGGYNWGGGGRSLGAN